MSVVLGGLGFIGSHLVDALVARGDAVRCFDRPLTQSMQEASGSRPHVTLVRGDFTCGVDIAEAIEGCDVCFHLVSTTLPKTSNADPVYDVETNLIGTLKLLDQASRSKSVKRIIFVSSGGTVYGPPDAIPIAEDHPTRPTCSYGITKLTIEHYLELYRQMHGLEYTVLRVANPYGERQRIDSNQGAVAVFLGKALRGEAIEIWGDGSVVRDYVHISDVVSGLVAASEVTHPPRIFNIGSGTGKSLNEVLDTIDSVLSTPTTRRYVAARKFDVPASVLDIDRARRHLAWRPRIDFRTGVDRTAAWLKESQG